MSIYKSVLSELGKTQNLIWSVPSVNAEVIKIVRERGDIGSSPHTWAAASAALGTGDRREPTRSEIAVGVALRLAYGHLKQARRDVYGKIRPGQAFGKLVNISETTLSHRLGAIAKTHDIVVLEHHLRSLISLLDGNGSAAFSPMNYAELAVDLYSWQDPNQRARVTSQWVRDAHINLRKETQAS